MKQLDYWWEGQKLPFQRSVTLEFVGNQEGLGDEVTQILEGLGLGM